MPPRLSSWIDRRWPNDAIENLVLADRCNGHKSNHLAATEHPVRWRTRLATAATDLRTIATATDWVIDADRTHALVHTTYTHMVAGTPLWLRGNEFELATGPTLLYARSAISSSLDRLRREEQMAPRRS